MKNIFTFLTIAFISIALQSCYNEYVFDPPEYDSIDELAIFRTGRVWEYQVDSTFYIENGSSADRVSRYYMKEEIVDTTIGLEGDLVYIAHISTKPDSNSSYTYLKQCYYRLHGNELIKQVDNVPIQIMQAPIYNGIEWNAAKYSNADFIKVPELNAADKTWNSEIISSSHAYEPSTPINGNIDFISNSIDVQLCDITDGGKQEYTDRMYFYDIYSPGIGLLYRVEQAYVVRSNINNKRGYKIEYKLLRYE